MTTQLPSILSDLAARGLTGQRKLTNISNSVDIGGFKQTKNFVEVIWTLTLPADPGLQASFTAESWKHTLIKVFKKEPQLGDELFDKSVYITTNDEEACLKLLRSDDKLSDMILDMVINGTTLQIQGTSVIWTKRVAQGDDPEPQPEHLLRVLSALMSA